MLLVIDLEFIIIKINLFIINILKKINLIAEVVNAVRDAIEKEVESCNARPEIVTTDIQSHIANSNSAN